MISPLLFIALFIITLTPSQGAELLTVVAGRINGTYPTNLLYFGRLTEYSTNTTKICPEQLPNGFSIECYGADIIPSGGVSFFVNGGRVQTEGISPPYMAAGDLDRGPDGLTYINPWTDWLEPQYGCSTRNTDCVLDIKCTFQSVEITKKLVIKKASSCKSNEK